MSSTLELKQDPTLRDETSPRWSFLEEESDPCVVVSEGVELIYVNGAVRSLVPDQWFGERCFEVLPTVDKTCAFHCPKIDAVNDSAIPPRWSIAKRRSSQLVLSNCAPGLAPLGVPARLPDTPFRNFTLVPDFA